MRTHARLALMMAAMAGFKFPAKKNRSFDNPEVNLARLAEAKAKRERRAAKLREKETKR